MKPHSPEIAYIIAQVEYGQAIANYALCPCAEMLARAQEKQQAVARAVQILNQTETTTEPKLCRT
jgi:hypothetical protein